MKIKIKDLVKGDVLPDKTGDERYSMIVQSIRPAHEAFAGQTSVTGLYGTQAYRETVSFTYPSDQEIELVMPSRSRVSP